MVIKTLYIFLLLLLISSCQRNKPAELFDVVVYTGYKNHYEDGRLHKIEKINQENYVGRKKITYLYEYKYVYKTDKEYEIQEYTFENNKKIISTIERYTSNSFELIYFKDGIKDTCNYRFTEYNEKGEIVYERVIRQFTVPKYDIYENDNYEGFYLYDSLAGIDMLKKYDFVTGDSSALYWFHDISYQDAIKKVPPTPEKRDINCIFSKSVGDTVYKHVYSNNELFSSSKTWTEDGRRIQKKLLQEENLIIQTEDYKMDDLNIHIDRTFNSRLDSIFYRNDKVIRKVEIMPQSKTITEYEYDSKGNVIKEISKIKFYPSFDIRKECK